MSASRPSLLEFPCLFPLKVIGKNVSEFEAEVLRIVQNHVPDAETGHLSRRPSAQHKYLALTISFIAHSQEQLDNLYQELNRHHLVVVTM
ncbi:MAG: YbeD family protein [Candidatus Binatia bacterium]